MSWREDVARINQLIRGVPSQGYVADFYSISGGNPTSYQEAIRIWADSHGVQSGSWMSDIIGIAAKLVSVPASSWVEALRFIRLYYAGTPPQIRAMVDNTDAWIVDNSGRGLVQVI